MPKNAKNDETRGSGLGLTNAGVQKKKAQKSARIVDDLAFIVFSGENGWEATFLIPDDKMDHAMVSSECDGEDPLCLRKLFALWKAEGPTHVTGYVCASEDGDYVTILYRTLRKLDVRPQGTTGHSDSCVQFDVRPYGRIVDIYLLDTYE